MSLFSKIFRTKKNVQVLDLSEKIKVLSETDSQGHCYFSYFFCGSYGNYLLSSKLDPQAFESLFKAHGGLKYFLPLYWTKELEESFYHLFVKWGASVFGRTFLKKISSRKSF